MLLLFPELHGLHCAEHALIRVVRLVQWLYKPLKCAVHTLHRRIRSRKTAVETLKIASESRHGAQHSGRWQGESQVST